MFRPISPETNDPDVIYVELLSGEPSPPRLNTPNIFNSTELSRKNTRQIITLSSLPSPEPQIVTIDSDLNEPTMPLGFGWQLPIIPTRLNNVNLPPDPFNNLETMAIPQPTAEGHEENYSHQSTEPSEMSPISTPR